MHGDVSAALDKAFLDRNLLSTVHERTGGRLTVIESPAFLPLSFFLLIAPGDSLADLIAERRLQRGSEPDAELQALCSEYYRNVVTRNDGVRTYHYSAAVERRRLKILEDAMRAGVPSDILQGMKEYRDAMLELRKLNKQPFPEVRDREYIPFMLGLLEKKHPGMHVRSFADVGEVAAWLQNDLDDRSHLIGLVRAGNDVHQYALSLCKGAGKSSLIALDSIHWTWNWHWKDTCTRKVPAPGYKAVLDFANVLAASQAARGAYIPMNVQKAPRNCVIHSMHFVEQIYEHAAFFGKLHENLQAGRLVHPFAREASPRLPYAREVSGLKQYTGSEVGILLRSHGSAYRSSSGAWGMLPWKGKGSIEMREGIVFHDLGYGSYAVHLASLLSTLAPEEELVTGARMSFTSENGSLETFGPIHVSAA
jgi:hypothetical protein